MVTDIRMPDMDGLEMVKAIREIDAGVKVIATTAYNDKPYLLRAIETKVDHYVMKPVDLKQFLSALEKCYQEILVHRAEEKRRVDGESLIRTLQARLDETDRLKGILPICSYCKNIRNEENIWEKVESFISKRTSAEFSHSICPSCLREHHPEDFAFWLKRRME